MNLLPSFLHAWPLECLWELLWLHPRIHLQSGKVHSNKNWTLHPSGQRWCCIFLQSSHQIKSRFITQLKSNYWRLWNELLTSTGLGKWLARHLCGVLATLLGIICYQCRVHLTIPHSAGKYSQKFVHWSVKKAKLITHRAEKASRYISVKLNIGKSQIKSRLSLFCVFGSLE